jgi:hypothetical protein
MNEPRKCTKCEKKFPREELIKWHGNRYCETCARLEEKSHEIKPRFFIYWGIGLVLLITLYVLFLKWLFKWK